MNLNIKELNKLAKEIAKNVKLSESMGSGLADEHIIVGAWQTMELDRLIKLRFIMNKLIHRKKEELAKKVGIARYRQIIEQYEKELN